MNESCFFRDKILISRDVDLTIEQIVEYILRDYLFSWSKEFVPDDEAFKEFLTIKIKNEIWLIISKLIDRMQEINAIAFFTETLPRIVQRHFEKFNLELAHQIDENQHIVRFMVARHLEDDRAELEFLRKICEYLLRILFPSNYAFTDEFIFLIREVLTNHVFFNLIDLICDPYFLNHQAIKYGSVVGPVAFTLDSNYGSFNTTPTASGNNSPGILICDDEEPKEDIADSIYDLLSEIFALKKAQHLIRRAIIILFQKAFGKTINRQIKDSIMHLTSEKFIQEQLLNFRDSFWPDGVLAEPSPSVTEDDKKLTYLLAKQYLINNIPDVFTSLIGNQNSRKGFLKIFEALQNKKANKQLFYVSIRVASTMSITLIELALHDH